MSYFRNAARGLKRALSGFLEDHMFAGLSVPQRKFVADACYGLLKSGSPWFPSRPEHYARMPS